MPEFLTIEDYNSRTEVSDTLLDIKKLSYQKDIAKICICEKCTVGNTINGEPFLRYLFKDINGRRIVGRQFGVTDLGNSTELLTSVQKRVVRIKFTPSIFQGFYLQVTDLKIIPVQESAAIQKKFFTNSIKDIEAESAYMKQYANMLIANPNIKKVYQEFNVEYKLSEGFYEEVLEGLKGSPLKLVNVFFGCSSTMFDKQMAAEMTTAYMFIEAIKSVTEKDSKNELVSLLELKSICDAYIDPEVKLIYDIVDSTIYLMLGLERERFQSYSIFIKRIRDFSITTYKDFNWVSNSNGIFTKDGKLFERR